MKGCQGDWYRTGEAPTRTILEAQSARLVEGLPSTAVTKDCLCLVHTFHCLRGGLETEAGCVMPLGDHTCNRSKDCCSHASQLLAGL